MFAASRRYKPVAFCCLAAMIVALGGCREDEKDRVLLYQKGTYLGKVDQKLDETQLNELRNRTKKQDFNL